MHPTIPRGKLDMVNTPFLTLLLANYFCCFPSALANVHPWPLVPFFEVSLKKSRLKATHNTFRDCRVQFSRNSCILKQLFFSIPVNSGFSNIYPDFKEYFLIIIRCKCLFFFIRQEPTTRPANNCLQIMVCSCAMSFNYFWLPWRKMSDWSIPAHVT